MKNVTSMIYTLVNVAQNAIFNLDYVHAEDHKKVYVRDVNMLNKAKSSLKALELANSQDKINMNEIRISSSLLLLSLSNMAFAEVNGDQETFVNFFKSNAMGADSVEKFVTNFLNAHKEALQQDRFVFDDAKDLIFDNFGIIEEFVEKDIKVEYCEDYNNGEMSFAQLLFETMSYALEIVVAAHYESLSDKTDLHHEDKEIETFFNMEKEISSLAPLTRLDKDIVEQSLKYYEELKKNKNRLTNRIATQKYYEMSCLI